MKQISIDELPSKLRDAVRRYFKKNGAVSGILSDVKFGLEGSTWVACDSHGRRGFGANPAVAARRLEEASM